MSIEWQKNQVDSYEKLIMKQKRKCVRKQNTNPEITNDMVINTKRIQR